jgi:predicted ATP-dependent serine protease
MRMEVMEARVQLTLQGMSVYLKMTGGLDVNRTEEIASGVAV